MAATAVPPITVEQFLGFRSPRGFRCELINGEIVLSPDPKPPHYDICERVYKFLEQVCPEPTYKVLQRLNLRTQNPFYMPSPDVMVIDYAKWVEAQSGGYPETAPYLVVEVISLSNRKRPIAAKVQNYLENGTPAVWVVYPKKRIVEVHGSEGAEILSERDRISLPRELPAASFAVKQLFCFAEKLLAL